MTVQSDICPTLDQETDQLLKLLPRGRAWITYRGGVRWAFFRALATVLQTFDAAVCALSQEFFCRSTSLLLSVWQAEYGYPDDCDPYADLCAKVAALGGQTCAYFEAVAAEIGWSIACVAPCNNGLGSLAMGCSTVGSSLGPGYLIFAVSLSLSTAVETQLAGMQMGCFQLGQPNRCGVDLTALDCVLQRIAPAHRQLVYVTVP